MTNPHRFDFHPDKYIAGVSAQLTAEEQGVYWMVCALIMSHRGPIKDDPIRIGKLCLVSKRRAERILSSLESKGKIERVSGEIRQKTAEKSVEKAQNIIETYRKNGLNGGRPSNNNKGLSKASGSENNSPPNLNLKPKPNPSKKESNQEHASPSGEVIWFNDFWTVYPKKVAKGGALKAYKSAIKRGATHEQIRSGAERYAASCRHARTEKQFTKNPATWLNQDCWLDEDGPPSGNRGNGQRASVIDAALAAMGNRTDE